jgi:hypothetical protein
MMVDRYDLTNAKEMRKFAYQYVDYMKGDELLKAHIELIQLRKWVEAEHTRFMNYVERKLNNG